jgi:hypothetical protein
MTDQPTSHARLGASSMSIWSACPAAPALWEKMPKMKNASSFFASEGTLAHSVAHSELTCQGDYPVGAVINVEGFNHTVTSDMLQCVNVYVEECEAIAQGAKHVAHEVTVSLDKLWAVSQVKPPEMFGTADFICVKDTTLYIRDLKYGRGAVVEVEDNPQLLYYAAGALLSLPAEVRMLVTNIDMGIVQPRAEHPDGPVRNLVISRKELIDWVETKLKPAVLRVMQNDTEFDPSDLKPGSHCRFCKALAACPAVAKNVQMLARTSFVDQPYTPDTPHTPVAPALLGDEQLARVLDFMMTIKTWLADVSSEALARIDRGTTIPGWKKIPKRANRSWKNTKEVIDILVADGHAPSEFMDMELKSVTQLEITLKNDAAGSFARVAHLIDKVSSGNTLAPVDDRREASPVKRTGFASAPLPEGFTADGS